jgi:hypothetical protein
MAFDTNRPFYIAECALCLQDLETEDVESFLAVSPCHPNPGRAEWREVEGLRCLCVGSVAANEVTILGELPSVYLIHPYCNAVITAADRHRTVFQCFRALGPILDGETPPTLRTWPWPLACTVYALVLHNNSNKEAASMLQTKVQMRLHGIIVVKERLPLELSDMILDYLPFELALILDSLSGRRCLNRLRQDPIARRFERAFQILGHEMKGFQHQGNQITLESEMSAQFVLIGGQWYLQDLNQTAKGSEERGHVKHLVFKHNKDRAPYIAVQVDDFGITHIAFNLEAGQPNWISPNNAKKQPAFFQDRSSNKEFQSVTVISDVRKAY